MSTLSIKLPSRGLLYGDKLPGGSVVLNALTSREQSILFNLGLDATQKIDSIIKNCLVPCGVSSQDLLMTDRLYILLVLRSNAFGSVYRFPYKCSCRAQTIQEIDISKDLRLKVYEISENLKEGDDSTCLGTSFREPFECTLPKSGDRIEFRLLRGSDEQSISLQAKRITMQSTDNSDPTFLLRLSLMIQTVNGKQLTSQEKIVYANMDAGDENFLSNYVESVESGIDLSMTLTCRSCGYSDEVLMPFTAEFFRPKLTGKTRGS